MNAPAWIAIGWIVLIAAIAITWHHLATTNKKGPRE